jgi:curved DNA-binding protein CbpA
MDVRRCLQLLELEEGASMEEARRSYRELVRVWHPDRFSGDPGLRRRAEEKSKELNVAYETLSRRLEQEGAREGPGSAGPEAARSAPAGTTEVLFEAGTRTLLTIWYSLGRAVRSVVAENEKRKGEGKGP